MKRHDAQRARIERQYRELRASNPDAFRACVEGAESVNINHTALNKLEESERLALIADIEQLLVDARCGEVRR